MNRLKELKKENKILRKQLDKVYLTLYYQIDFYLRLHDLTIEQYRELTNQILLDFKQWANEGKDVWSTIGDPKHYVEVKLIKYGVESKYFIVTLLRRNVPVIIGVICFLIIFLNTFNMSNLIRAEAYTFNLTNIYILETLGSLLFYLFLPLISYWTLFKRDNKLVVYAVTLFLVYTISKMYIYGLNETNKLVLYIPRVYVYITLGLSILAKVIDRKKLWV